MYIPSLSPYSSTGWPAQMTSPLSQQFAPQQLQQILQVAQIQQQQLQQFLQIIPAQLQQIQQLIQLVPHQVQQLLHVVAQQQFGGGQGVLGAGFGQVPQGLGVPFQSASPFNAPYAPGQVM